MPNIVRLISHDGKFISLSLADVLAMLRIVFRQILAYIGNPNSLISEQETWTNIFYY